jgi:hypothetical protein
VLGARGLPIDPILYDDGRERAKAFWALVRRQTVVLQRTLGGPGSHTAGWLHLSNAARPAKSVTDGGANVQPYPQ